jgi:hypothetical protein
MIGNIVYFYIDIVYRLKEFLQEQERGLCPLRASAGIIYFAKKGGIEHQWVLSKFLAWVTSFSKFRTDMHFHDLDIGNGLPLTITASRAK